MAHLPHVQSDPWEFALDAVRSNTRAMLVYVVEHSGSVPGVTGTNVVVTESAFAGTIGGGAAEKDLVERALAHQASAEIVRFRHTPSDGGTLCSGLQIFALLSLTPAHEEALAQIVRALAKHRTGTLHLGPDTFRFDDGPAAPHVFTDEGSDWSYKGPLGLLETLTIVGGGHVALAFSRLMVSLPYRVVVLDNRAELATLEANTFAHERRVVDYADVAEHVPDGPRSWVVIMTYGHAHDRFVLERLLGREYAYIGVLGSKAKIRTMFAEMKESGASAEALGAVRAPVGLPIGSHTPEEIAVSIAGEIIAMRNGKA